MISKIKNFINFSKNKNLIFYAMAYFLFFVIDFGLNSFLSFFLSTNSYLFYQNILNVLSFSTTLVSLGVPFSIIYIVSKKSNSENKKLLFDASNLVFKFFYILLIIYVCIFLFDSSNLYLIVALFMGLSLSIKQNLLNYFLGYKKLDIAALVRIFGKLISGGIIIFFVFILNVKNNYMLASILIFSELMSIVFLNNKWCFINLRQKKKYYKRLVSYGKYAFMSNLASMTTIAFPIVFMNYLKISEITIIEYSIAYIILRYSSLLLGPFMQLIVPFFTTEQKQEKVRLMFKKYSILLLVFGFFMILILQIIIDPLVTTFYNEKYHNAIILFQYLSLIIPFMFLASFSSTVISALGKVNFTSRIQMVLMIFALILGSYLILKYKEYGALYIIMIIYILQVLINYFILAKMLFLKNKII